MLGVPSGSGQSPKPTKWEMFWSWCLFFVYWSSYLGVAWLVVVYTHGTVWVGSYSNLMNNIGNYTKSNGILWFCILGSWALYMVATVLISRLFVIID